MGKNFNSMQYFHNPHSSNMLSQICRPSDFRMDWWPEDRQHAVTEFHLYTTGIWFLPFTIQLLFMVKCVNPYVFIFSGVALPSVMLFFFSAVSRCSHVCNGMGLGLHAFYNNSSARFWRAMRHVFRASCQMTNIRKIIQGTCRKIMQGICRKLSEDWRYKDQPLASRGIIVAIVHCEPHLQPDI